MRKTKYFLKVTFTSHPELFYKKDVYVYETFSEKQLCWSLLLIKCYAGGFQHYLKYNFGTNVFPVNAAEFFKEIILDKTIKKS